MTVPVSITELALVAVALYTLVTASQRAIDRLLSLARYYDVPDLVVGMTVLAIGTSLPELGAHITASLGILSGVLDAEIAAGVVLGGNMGSSTAQQLLVFGVFLLGYGSVDLSRSLLRQSYLPMVLAFVLTLAVSVDGTISRLDGGLLLLGYAVYVVTSVSQRERSTVLTEPESTNARSDALVAAVMLALVLASASLLLASIETVVRELALGGSMVGVVTIGIASALPELTMVLEAIRRRTPTVAVGTLLGSNVVNPLVGIGLGGLISTYRVPHAVVVWDLPVKIVVAVGLIAHLAARRDWTLTRNDGLWLVALYFAFLTGRLLVFPGQ